MRSLNFFHSLKFYMFIIFFIIGSLYVSPVNAADYFLCKRETEVRSIRVDYVTGACRIIYTKQGIDQMMGQSTLPSDCAAVQGRIRKNLEEGSWKCRVVKESVVSDLTPEQNQ